MLTDKQIDDGRKMTEFEQLGKPDRVYYWPYFKDVFLDGLSDQAIFEQRSRAAVPAGVGVDRFREGVEEGE